MGLAEATVLGDSQIIINVMVKNTNVADLQLARTISRIKSMIKHMNLTFFHILRTNNKEADVEENRASQLDVGSILRDNELSWDPIP